MGSTSEYPDLISAKLHIGRFIDDVYCTKRIHSSLGYLAPAEFAAQRPKLSLRLTLSNKIFVSSFTGPLQPFRLMCDNPHCGQRSLFMGMAPGLEMVNASLLQ
jgi:hypothetical protein